MMGRKRMMAVAIATALSAAGVLGLHSGTSLVAKVSHTPSARVVLAGDVHDLGIYGACRDSGGSIAECKEMSIIPT